ncbi:MAG: ribonuclease P protein component [Barnesiella sp.]|nr:ribonuclease P protein component [Bacteroidales bacterium]MBD5245714.1 ribonuclease P protein component [Barnesiella sp.]MBD5248962.1 ribonuclease P protein component [Barnesiella sp.]MDE6082129.1 ribonuclease P protein component [Muribaculaceae bacterium]
MKQYGLGKAQKLCSKIAIDSLFRRSEDSHATLAYPVRVVWRCNPSRKADPQTPKFLISVPKRKLRHAVDRVQMRRRIREAYRLNHREFIGELHLPLDMVFIYVADSLLPYQNIERAVRRCLQKISEKHSPSC